MTDDLTFSYANSDHAQGDASPSAGPAPASGDHRGGTALGGAQPEKPEQQKPAVDQTFSYNKSQPETVAADAPDVPDEIKALRDTSERKMYSPQKTFAEALPDAGDDLDAVKAMNREWREVFQDVGLNPVEAKG